MMGVCLPKSPLRHDGVLLSWRWKDCPLETGNDFLVLLCVCGFCFIKLCLSKTMSLLT